ncbi:hypothetical protein Btru_052216 [Bulinus truncatus]|nr:hypothetical protein Btru_052216 [Bulinus truncatus]
MWVGLTDNVDIQNVGGPDCDNVDIQNVGGPDCDNVDIQNVGGPDCDNVDIQNVGGPDCDNVDIQNVGGPDCDNVDIQNVGGPDCDNVDIQNVGGPDCDNVDIQNVGGPDCDNVDIQNINSKPKPSPPPYESQKETRVMKDKRADSGSSTSSSGSSSKTWTSKSSGDQNTSQEKYNSKEVKKVRRKLPPIPVGEDPVVTSKSKNRRQKTPVKRSDGVDQEDGAGRVRTPPQQPHAGQIRTMPQQSQGGQFRTPPQQSQAGQIRILPQESQADGYCARQRVGRDSDDSMNDDDLEVARLTTRKQKSVSPKRKTNLADTGKSKSLDSSEYSRSLRDMSDGQRVKPPMQRTASLGQGPKDETDEIIDSLIEIYGIPCTEAMKCLKKRLQEELRRVTKDRKRKLEELEEIRALQMQLGVLKMESHATSRTFVGKRSPSVNYQSDSQQDSRKRGTSVTQSSSLTPRSSPQVTPRRQRHKRQSSDPMISKFSPIKEDKDIESDFQTRSHESSDSRTLKYQTDDSSQSGISDAESTRSEPIKDARYSKIKPADYSRLFYNKTGGGGGSADHLQYADYDSNMYDHSLQPLSGSRSEQQLSSNNRTSLYYSDDDETKFREEKKALLQYEIMKRKQQLEETARLKSELLKLARARQSMASSYDDIPRHYVSPAAPQRPVPRGIIKPIEDESYMLYDLLAESRPCDYSKQRSREHSRDRSRERSRERRDDRERDTVRTRDNSLDNKVTSDQRGRDSRPRPQQTSSQDSKRISNYSSTEYLAHKQESASRRYMDETIQYGSQGWIAGEYPSDSLTTSQAYSQPVLNQRVDSVQSTARRDEVGIVSSVTLPNIYGNRVDREFRPVGPYRDPNYISTSISDTDGSPASDVTPAMPLLDDVKTKSRTIIRNIGSGSRPVSAEFSAGDLEDLLNGMYRVESDNSVDADEPIMKHMTEGGVTILKQIDRKRRPAPVEPHKYDFPIKRILVTRDAKDKSITGNGLGMKIVGGKEIPGTNELGAYVTAIYPIIADQLHGELDVGDQVLEWNGIHLTGLSADEVQDIISQTNGEIEMVVRAQMIPVLLTDLAAQPESCRSSYDNLALPSYEESVKEPYLQRQLTGSTTVNNRQGVDPRQLAAQLEEIREAASPAENSPSSSHQDVATPSVSSPCSTPRSDPTSTSSDRQQQPSSRSADRPEKNVDRQAADRQSNRQRRKHSPILGKTSQHRSSPQKQQTSKSQPNQSSPPPPYTPRQQINLQPNNEIVQTEQSVSARKKKQDFSALNNCALEKSRHSTYDQQNESSCSSPALNDRLRASPPLDTRRSIKTRPSKKGKDNFIFPTKSSQEPERGEDFGLGEIQLQISHDDFDNTLNVHVIQARNLRPRDLNGLSDPFVKLYLLPGRGPENKRRTKHIPRTLNPEWHQTVMFQDVARLELQNKVLEITVWDYDRFKANDFLGELIIELREFAFLDNKPHWYPLKEHVTMQSFELPKSTVAPPKPTEISKSHTRSPRQGKKHGISSLRSLETVQNDNETQRRKSLGSLSGSNVSVTDTPEVVVRHFISSFLSCFNFIHPDKQANDYFSVFIQLKLAIKN